MEITTVSPSPASPTEGDDLCEIDGTNVAIHSVTLLICLCGLVGNGAVLHLLSLKDRNSDIFALAFADFLFLLFTAPAALLFLVEDVSCSPILPLLYLSFLFQLSVFSYYWALFHLTSIGGTDYLYKFCTLCCHGNFPMRLWWLVVSGKFWAFFALFTVIPAVTNLCPSHQQEHCRAALIFMYALILLLCAAPTVISSTINFIKAMRGSKKQKLKRHEIVLFLIVLFVLLLSFCNFVQGLGYIVVSSQVMFLLNCIHSSIKPFIYFLAGRCWKPCSLGSLQLSLRRVFDEQEEEAAHSNNAPVDTESEPVHPCSAQGPWESAALGISLSDLSNEYPQDAPTSAAFFLQEKRAEALPWMVFERCSAGSTLEHGFPPPSWMHMAPSTAAGLSSDPQLNSPWNDRFCLGPQGMNSISFGYTDEFHGVLRGLLPAENVTQLSPGDTPSTG